MENLVAWQHTYNGKEADRKAYGLLLLGESS